MPKVDKERAGKRVMGIDPGLERIGVAVVDRVGSRVLPVYYGLIQTPRVALPDRLLLIEERLSSLIDTYQPDFLGTERLLFAANKTTALDVSKALGVILLCSAKSGLAWEELTPPEIKKAVVGNGAADKRQVEFMVTRLLGLAEPPKPDDVADALAIALAFALRSPTLTRP